MSNLAENGARIAATLRGLGMYTEAGVVAELANAVAAGVDSMRTAQPSEGETT